MVSLCTFHSAFLLSIGSNPVNSFSDVPCASPDRELTVSYKKPLVQFQELEADQYNVDLYDEGPSFNEQDAMTS